VPETREELYARAAAALRMPPVETWETFPFDGDLRPRALLPPVAREEPRAGAGRVGCWDDVLPPLPEALWRANIAAVVEPLDRS